MQRVVAAYVLEVEGADEQETAQREERGDGGDARFDKLATRYLAGLRIASLILWLSEQ
ncbi:hypothetical protein [Streptomyces buecherae]|uniref:Uncharacterized protein n=1 Tax=Streptomyces buecherae TaxID=2763006 RepID=A0A7H8N6D3_9ACTN|nr:hypothetical protein [Streptomyces buecherae]QKW49919.1 hypothetical protein HUT08_10600 [Streptomyces buecherae]